ncbi:MAG TPA: DMT family transporter [Gemmatimonadales bacterium]|nr:DMT family transporter [Gemmatimonadales bacterium]
MKQLLFTPMATSTTTGTGRVPASPLPRRRLLTTQDAGMLLVCLIWGLNFSVTKSAFDQIPPLPFTAVRFIVSSLLLWGVLRWLEGPAKLPPGALGLLVLLGVVGNTCYQLAFTVGLSRTTASNSALILSTVPTVVAVFAGALGLERITSRMRWGIALGTLGVALVIATRGVRFDMHTLSGDLLTVLAVVFWAGYTVGLRRVPTGVSPLRVTTITTLAGTPGLVLAGLPGSFDVSWARLTPSAWLALAYASVLSLVVAYLLWNRSVKAVGGTRTAIYMCLTPLVAVAGAWLLLGERPHPLQGVGAAFIITGVLLTRSERAE